MSLASRVLLLTRADCHLCVEAAATVRETCEALGVSWQTVDVDSDQRLRARYTDHVPVTFADQNLVGYWFVDRAALEACLSGAEPRPMTRGWVTDLADEP